VGLGFNEPAFQFTIDLVTDKEPLLLFAESHTSPGAITGKEDLVPTEEL
jgi:hypothetical protein